MHGVLKKINFEAFKINNIYRDRNLQKLKPIENLKLAAIDIGSNAARMQISKVLDDNGQVYFKKIEYIRFPLRLGQDVFKEKIIGPQKEENLYKFLHVCKLLIELHEVKDYAICATSAMREAKNAEIIIARMKRELGMEIDVISGNKEAEVVNNVLVDLLDEKQYLHIDVGGGSTELNIYSERKKIHSHSFKIGTVRTLEHTDSPLVWRRMKEWIEENMPHNNLPVSAVGTGGNINKLSEMARGKSELTIKELEGLHDYIKGYSLEERINKLQLNPDRADVIVVAAEIYLHAMKAARAEKIITPDIGLKDGIIRGLYEKNKRAMFKNK